MNRRKAQNTPTAKQAAQDELVAIHALASHLTARADQIGQTTDPDWGTVGSLGHIKAQLLEALMGTTINRDESEDDCRVRILRDLQASKKHAADHKALENAINGGNR